MAPNEVERITKLETMHEFVAQDIQEIKTDLKNLPDKIESAVGNGVKKCRELQDLRGKHTNTDSEKPSIKSASKFPAVTGWTLAICQGVYLFGKFMSWF